MYTEIQFRGYKVFSEEIIIDRIENVNVIIGKNNSGKSTLLDIMEMVYSDKQFQKHSREVDFIKLKLPITEEIVRDVFSSGIIIDDWDQEKYWEKVKEKDILIELVKGIKGTDYRVVETADMPIINPNYFRGNFWDLDLKRKSSEFRRLSAERDIVPEKAADIELSSTGKGASNLVYKFLNDGSVDESIVENSLLEALNEIMSPEAEFENIRIQYEKKGGEPVWEIYLKEKEHKRVPLSKSGSGIKTIILVLLNLLVIPNESGHNVRNIVYGFEELENNLHPAIQKKLFDYIYKFAVQNDIYIFLTTHSHIAINMFFEKNRACIYHVTKGAKGASVKRIESHIDKTGILDDLDIKASDILQANGIIWVEGPSDRIYIKRWLDIFFDNRFEEGKHYQFLYYGGRLLSHYSAEEETDLINIFKVNRNAAIVMDSDKRKAGDELNCTKKRIIEELKKADMFCWGTEGKEIENYIPKDAIEKLLDRKIETECQTYELFSQYIAPYYKNFEKGKVLFTKKIKDCLIKENSLSCLDLQKQVGKLYESIEKWNI
nr:AAA family ATPase [uncultured Blautia sp.]